MSDGRVNGCLALSRAIGDFDFKRAPATPAESQAVTAMPEARARRRGGRLRRESCAVRAGAGAGTGAGAQVLTRPLSDADEFMILACDGIWDVLSSQACVDFVRRRLAQGMPLTEARAAPRRDAARSGACDAGGGAASLSLGRWRRIFATTAVRRR